MKCVILAAGKGERMRPLTLKTPKPLLKVNGKAVIDYALEALPSEVTEVIIAVRYLRSKIKKHVGPKNRDRTVKYVLGSDKGTAYSFLATKKYLKNERFLFVYGDEIPSKFDITSCLKKELSILTFRSVSPEKNGIAYLRRDGSIKKIVEKPKKSTSRIGVDGVMVLNTDVFDIPPKLARGEFYFSTMIGMFVANHKVFPVKAKNFIGDFTTPEDLARVEKLLLSRNSR